jgi:hypothetical protein
MANTNIANSNTILIICDKNAKETLSSIYHMNKDVQEYSLNTYCCILNHIGFYKIIFNVYNLLI